MSKLDRLENDFSNEIVTFTEDGAYFVFSARLDICGYGKTKREAWAMFRYVLQTLIDRDSQEE